MSVLDNVVSVKDVEVLGSPEMVGLSSSCAGERYDAGLMSRAYGPLECSGNGNAMAGVSGPLDSWSVRKDRELAAALQHARHVSYTCH